MKIRSFSCIFPPNSLLIGTERSLIDWAVSNYLLEQIAMKVFFVHFLKKENSLPKKYFFVKIHDLKFCANSSSQFLPLANRQIKVGPCHFEVLHAAFLYARMMPKDRYAMLDNDKLQQCQQQSIVLDLLQFFCETTFDAMSQFKAC